jgi:hypothetical protein
MAGPINPKNGLKFDPPTKDTNGVPFAMSQIVKFQIGLGQTSGSYSKIIDDTTLETGQQATPMSAFGSLAVGQWYAAVRTVGLGNKISAWSPELPFVIDYPTPEPPGNLSIA